jgi:hypothetical protein
MNDLVRWYGEQLDEDERIAKAATPGPWVDQGGYVTDVGPKVQVTDYGTQDGEPEEDKPQGRADSAHIARHDPARVLREIDAKRQVLAAYEQASRYATTTWGQSNADQSRARTLDKMVRLLASVYSDRPSYRSEWAP